MSQYELSHRDHFAMNAPITRSMVDAVYGEIDPNLSDDTTRACYFAVWSFLTYEWADAMIAQSSEGPRKEISEC